MQPTNCPSEIFVRIVVGLFVGALIGLLIEAPFVQAPPENRIILLIGPGIGGILLAIVAVFFGGRELQGWFKIVSISFLIGVVVGALGGAIVYPTIMVAIRVHAGFDPVFSGKLHNMYRDVGITFGIPIGAAIGLLVGLSIWLWTRHHATSALAK